MLLGYAAPLAPVRSTVQVNTVPALKIKVQARSAIIPVMEAQPAGLRGLAFVCVGPSDDPSYKEGGPG